MPAGYEKLRDALIRKGKSEAEAKSMAAAIWNKHHKEDQVTNKPHKEMSRVLKRITELSNVIPDLREFGVASTLSKRAGMFAGKAAMTAEEELAAKAAAKVSAAAEASVLNVAKDGTVLRPGAWSRVPEPAGANSPFQVAQAPSGAIPPPLPSSMPPPATVPADAVPPPVPAEAVPPGGMFDKSSWTPQPTGVHDPSYINWKKGFETPP